jgi:hypothetical protein
LLVVDVGFNEFMRVIYIFQIGTSIEAINYADVVVRVRFVMLIDKVAPNKAVASGHKHPLLIQIVFGL